MVKIKIGSWTIIITFYYVKEVLDKKKKAPKTAS